MMKASEQFHIPYNSFREHCYGLRRSRKRGAARVLSHAEEQELADWVIAMSEVMA